MCVTGLSGLREVLARVRHDLRGGPAPLRRVALRLRAAVPADDGEARRRLDRRALAGDLDRPEDDLAQPALDGRHGDRDLRLPAPPLRADRPAALPGLRAADRRPVARPDRRAGAPARRGHEVHGQRAGRPRPQGRVQGRARGAPPRRIHAREGRRRAAAARGGHRPRQEVQAHDRGRRRPARDEGRPAPAADAVDRDRDVAGGGARRHRRRRRRVDDVLARTSPAPITASRSPSSSRASSRSTRRTAPARAARGSARSSRSTPTCSSPTRRSRSRRARSYRGRSASQSFYDSVIEAIAERYEIPLDVPWRELTTEQQDKFLHGTGGEKIFVTYRNRMGRKRQYTMAFEGLVDNLQRRYRETDSSQAARPDRGVHELPAVSRVRRGAAQAGGARRDDRRPARSTASRRCRWRAHCGSSTSSS